MIFNKNKLKKFNTDAQKKHTILLVDDEPENLATQKALLDGLYNVLCAGSGAAALDLIKSLPQNQEIHLIISDQRMPGMDGVTFLSNTLELCPKAIRIILTGYSDIDAVVAAINKAHVYQFLLKPFDSTSLLRTVELALRSAEMDRANEELLGQLKDLNATLEQKVADRTSQLQKANDDIARKNKLLESLLEAGAALHGASDEQSLLETAINRLTDLFPGCGFGCALRTIRRNILTSAFFCGITDQFRHLLIGCQGKLSSEEGEELLKLTREDADGWILNPIYNGSGEQIGIFMGRYPTQNTPDFSMISIYISILGSLVENRRLLAALGKAAHTDGLTGLYNRQFFDREHQRCIRQAGEYSEWVFSILFIDVNGLKHVNDDYGHEAGDQMITKVAGVLNAVCRDTDIVSRYGGDEFVVLCPSTSQDLAENLIERIESGMEDTRLEVSDEQGVRYFPIHCSIGRADSLECAPEKVLETADERMYRSKQEWYRSHNRYR